MAALADVRLHWLPGVDSLLSFHRSLFCARTRSTHQWKTSKIPAAMSGPRTETSPSQSLSLRYVSAALPAWFLERARVLAPCSSRSFPQWCAQCNAGNHISLLLSL